MRQVETAGAAAGSQSCPVSSLPVTQFFIHLSSAEPTTVAVVASRAGHVLDVLQPGCRRNRIHGPGYDGWVTKGHPARVSGYAHDGALDVIVAGTWFMSNPVVSSVESLASRISADGIDATASRLEGPFALAVHDRLRRALHVVTDVAGTLHVFAARDADRGWMISTSSTWLAAMTAGALDPVAVHEFVATGIVYEDRTLWQGVRKLGQATIATFAPDGTFSERRYWSFADLAPERDSMSTSVERLGQSLAAASTAIGTRYPRVLCDITGGYDSRATIAGFMIAQVPFSGTVSGPDESRDVRLSRAIAAHFAIPHGHAIPQLRFDLSELDDSIALTDGEYDSVEYARVAAIHREHARTHDISVNGSFGELARGYWWELLWPRIGARRPLDSAMLARRRFAAARYEPAVLSDAAHFDLASHMRDVIERVNAPLRGMPNTMLMDHAYFGLRMHRWQGRIASSTTRIWPCVSPFAFRSVLEPVLEARAASRVRSLLIRTLLARFVPALANFPLEAGYPALPAKWSNLHRFWPLASHYSGRIRTKLAPRTAARGGAGSPADSPQPTEYPAAGAFDALLGCDVFAADALGRFLASGRRDGQYSRLVTVGVALTKVTAARAASLKAQPATV